MPVQEPEARNRNFEEVALGYTLALARLEAERCLQCAKPRCVERCPVEVPIPEFIRALRDGDLAGATRAMQTKNSLPAICGRVCPQESQCEEVCVLRKKGESVAIGRLERFVGDCELAQRTLPLERRPATGKRVAVVGSGPAGLSCAVDLAREGHAVTIYESLHDAGGVLTYGIPEFRLPTRVVQGEIRYAAESLGIEIKLDHIIGRTATLEELLAEYNAVFVGSGAGLPSFMAIPGINLNGVMSANEFLTRVNLMQGYRFPDYDTPVKVGRRVAVVGAGNVAMDAARCSLRLQRARAAEGDPDPGEVHVVYRRSREEVPARAEEVEHAEEEGVIFDFLTNPLELLGTEQGRVRAMRCIRMELGEPDDSGRRRPVPVAGSEFEMPVDTVIFALGTSPNPLVFVDAEGLERRRWGTVVADEEHGRTTMPRVWAGGDVVTGAATVVSAMGAGKHAAADINAFLRGEGDPWSAPPAPPIGTPDR
ncbi:MAG: NADPH-dependent glutamate synthase [Candidatus Latescibacterota bacterium]